MSIDHHTLVWFSKSVGLLYLIGLSIAVVAYVYWPSNKQRFERAATTALRDEAGGDQPWH
ncbi:MAG: cbb3-type cytochrome c oxidase subunit 3 [Alphaproteobacteria bacterium]|nr:cbb3-type cytochrome c oxidase subunit 3 [Alphaproteobacteria bacterium]